MKRVGKRAHSLLNTELRFAKKVKYLSVTIVSSLTWNSHIKNRVNGAYTNFELMWNYAAIISALLTYGTIVWWSKIYQTTTTHKVNKIQRTAYLL